MPPSAQDSKLTGISIAEAYTAIKHWYLENLPLIDWRSGRYYMRASALIRALPDADDLTDLEARAVFAEVLSGLLEWGYSESDGRFRMGEYAYAALKTAGKASSLTAAERAQLQSTALGPFLSSTQRS